MVYTYNKAHHINITQWRWLSHLGLTSSTESRSFLSLASATLAPFLCLPWSGNNSATASTSNCCESRAVTVFSRLPFCLLSCIVTLFGNSIMFSIRFRRCVCVFAPVFVPKPSHPSIIAISHFTRFSLHTTPHCHVVGLLLALLARNARCVRQLSEFVLLWTSIKRTPI